jgi:hypothetical protein
MRCSFCNKAQAEVKKLIAGPTVFICDECVQVCTDMIRGERDFPPIPVVPTVDSGRSTRVVTCRMCGMLLPSEEGLAVPERGVLCLGCIGEVEASLARRREGTT